MGQRLDQYDPAAAAYPLWGDGGERGTLRGRIIDPKSMFYSGIGDVNAQLVGGGAAGGTAGDRNVVTVMSPIPYFEEWFIEGAGQTIKYPVPVAGGLDITLDATNNEGHQAVIGGLSKFGACAFTVGTHACFLEGEFTLNDITGTDWFGIGWRKHEAFTATVTDYTDFAMVACVAALGLLRLYTDLNDSGTPTSTSTGVTIVDQTRFKLRIEVALTGVVTVYVNGVNVTPAVFTFDAGDVIVPWRRLLHDTDVAEATVMHRCEVGLLGETKAILP